jgi:hypothetical protein
VSKLIHVEDELLSDGRAEVSRIGRLWFFSRFYADDDQPPETSDILTKEEAYKRLEDALRSDVMELD